VVEADDKLHARVRVVETLADAIRERHGGIAAILFYGSCLRQPASAAAPPEGILDFYVVVDRYRDAYRGRPLALANAILPPNVFHVMAPWRGEPVRAKYAVISMAQFRRGLSPASLQTSLWARFAQPCRLVWVRDPQARAAVGAALADAFVRNEGYQALGEAISAQLPSFWVNMQPEFKAEHVPLVQAFDALRTQLERLGSGYGIERVLYELNPMMPCYSAMIRNHMVTSANELLSALEEVAGQPARPREPMDRHIAAFLIARYRKLDERLIVLTTPGGEDLRRISALLNVLADVQKRFGPASLPNLCAWMVELMGPAIERFHSRAHREKLQNEATRMAHEGNLAVLLKLIDDPAAIRKDEIEFAKARRLFQLAKREVDKLKLEISDRDEIMETSGRQVAAIVGSMLATLAFVGIVVYRLVLR
jgi:hypothetical protein